MQDERPVLQTEENCSEWCEVLLCPAMTWARSINVLGFQSFQSFCLASTVLFIFSTSVLVVSIDRLVFKSNNSFVDWIFACIAFCAWVLWICMRATSRRALRRHYNINGSFASDVCLHTCCSCFAFRQELRMASTYNSRQTETTFYLPTEAAEKSQASLFSSQNPEKHARTILV